MYSRRQRIRAQKLSLDIQLLGNRFQLSRLLIHASCIVEKIVIQQLQMGPLNSLPFG